MSPSEYTLHLLPHIVNLSIRVVNQLVHLAAEHDVLVGQAPSKRLLVQAGSHEQREPSNSACHLHLLRGLISKERQGPSRALRNQCRRQATQHTCLVVLGRIQVCHDRVVRVAEGRVACWTRSGVRLGMRETEAIGAGQAEDVAAGRDYCLLVELRAAFEVVAAEDRIHDRRNDGCQSYERRCCEGSSVEDEVRGVTSADSQCA